MADFLITIADDPLFPVVMTFFVVIGACFWQFFFGGGDG